MLFITFDEARERIRIFTPILNTNDLQPGQLERMMEANFHSATEAKYALFEGFVVSVFMHPVQDLNDTVLQMGLTQVSRLHNTFGTSYTSTDKSHPYRRKRENKKPVNREREFRS